MPLLDRRLLVVLGKGGVGRTTLTAALGLAAARRGLRTLAIEVGGQTRLARLFEVEADVGQEVPVHPGLSALTLDARKALEEYLVLTLRVRALAERLVESRGFGYLAAAAPGLRELVTLGKICHLAEQRGRDGRPRYDLLVLDAPASGHALGLLRAPRQWAEVARVGRIASEARAIASFLADPARTALVLVTLAEEMPVTEAIETAAQLDELGLTPSACIVNGLYPGLFSAEDTSLLATAVPAGETARAALSAARSHAARRRQQEEELARLETAMRLPLGELPFLFRPQLDLDGVTELADRLEGQLERLLRLASPCHETR